MSAAALDTRVEPRAAMGGDVITSCGAAAAAAAAGEGGASEHGTARAGQARHNGKLECGGARLRPPAGWLSCQRPRSVATPQKNSPEPPQTLSPPRALRATPSTASTHVDEGARLGEVLLREDAHQDSVLTHHRQPRHPLKVAPDVVQRRLRGGGDHGTAHDVHQQGGRLLLEQLVRVELENIVVGGERPGGGAGGG